MPWRRWVSRWALSPEVALFDYCFPNVHQLQDYNTYLKARRVYAVSAICLIYNFFNAISSRSMLAVSTPVLDVLCPGLQAFSILLIRLSCFNSSAWVLFGSVVVHSTVSSFNECTAMVPSRIFVVMTIASCSVGFIGMFITAAIGVVAILSLDTFGLAEGGIVQFKTMSVALIVYNSLWSVIRDVCEKGVQDRLMMESEHKNLFLAKMSHEMRTPLVGIVGIWELIEDSFDKVNPLVRAVSPVMHNCLENIQRHIADVLDIAKMSQGIVQLQLAAHYLQDETLRPAAQLFQAKAFAKGLAFEFITDIASDVCVMTDRVRLSQIVFNLLTNAIKFTDKGGIRFTTTLRPRPHSTLQELHIKVDDTGLGIPEKELPTIFDVFEQGYVGLDRGGSGLGLAIAKQLVNLMNGDISVKSRLAKDNQPGGTSFEVNIPMTVVTTPIPGRDKTLQATEPVRLVQHKGRVLLAEDNQASQMVLQRMIERLGYLVTVVENGKLAMDVLANAELLPPGHPDRLAILLLDLEMPVMDGRQVLREMASQHMQTPVVVLTANTVGKHDLGLASAVMTKPTNLIALSDAISKHGRFDSQTSAGQTAS